MENPTLNEVIKASPVLVHRGRYAYLKGQEKELKNHFLISQDNDEITIVTETAFENSPMQTLCSKFDFKEWNNPQWKEGITYKLLF